MNIFNDPQTPPWRSLHLILDVEDDEWERVRSMPAQPLYRLSIRIRSLFPGDFDPAQGWSVPGTVLGRLESLRRFADVQKLDISLEFGPPLTQATPWSFMPNPNFDHLPAVADALEAFVREIRGLEVIQINFGQTDPTGALQRRIVHAAPAVRGVEIQSVVGVAGVLANLPPTATYVSIMQWGSVYQVRRGASVRMQESPMLSAEEIATVLGGRRLEGLQVILRGVPRRSSAFSALLRPLRMLNIDLDAASQRELDALAAYLAEMQQLRWLTLSIRGGRAGERPDFDLMGLSLALAGLQLEHADINLDRPWSRAGRWSYQHILLLNALLRSERLKSVHADVRMPTRDMKGVGRTGGTLLRAVQTYPLVGRSAALPPEMLLKVFASTGGYPEWFLVALRLPLGDVIPHLRRRRERGRNVGFFLEEDEPGSDGDEMAERPMEK